MLSAFNLGSDEDKDSEPIAFSNPRLNEWYEVSERFQFDGQSICYLDHGQGAPLLLVHGFPTASWDWHKVLPKLASDFRLIAPDMLGFGVSDKPKRGDYSVPAHADLHQRLLGHLGITDVHIMTYSSGSSVVQQMLANSLRAETSASPNVLSVTFLNGGLFPDSNHPKTIQRLLLSPLGPLIARLSGRSSLDKSLRAIFGPDTQPNPQLITDYWELLCLNQGNLRLPQLITYLNDRRNLADIWRSALIKHPAKKQLIVGLTDSISGAATAAEYRDTIPNPRIIELANIGHYPQLEAADIVIDAVRKIALQERSNEPAWS